MSEVTPEELHAAAAVWRKANVEAWRYFIEVSDTPLAHQARLRHSRIARVVDAIKAFEKAEEALR